MRERRVYIEHIGRQDANHNGEDEMNFYNAYEDNAKRPAVGDIVCFSVKVPAASTGMLFDYTGRGVYMSESVNGFFIEITECSEQSRVGDRISVRKCYSK